jgi:5-hydroxyisourate hydrolase-like protein (transthyretin family)
VRISVYVADAASGVAVGDLPVHLAQWRPEGWRRVWAGRTGPGGRVAGMSLPDHEGAVFELGLDTDCYYTTLGVVPFFHQVRVVFHGGDAERVISVVLAPQSYLVYAIAPPATTR